MNPAKITVAVRATLLSFSLILWSGAASWAKSVSLVALGDSLTAGYGLAAGEGLVPQLTQALRRDGLDVTLINAGVSGDTTSGGLSRLDWSVPSDTDAVILALGGNDALRAISPDITETNLAAIISQLQERGQAVFLIGMRAPPNLGQDYTAAFDQIYPRLARKFDLDFYPFFLEGVAGRPTLNLTDGIHPNAQGIQEIVSRLTPSLKYFIEQRLR